MKKTFIVSVSAVALALGITACSSKVDQADMVVYGKIFTSEPQELAEAFAVKDGKYVYVGDSIGVKKYVGENTRIIDRTGKGMVMAGCTEGHGHYLVSGFVKNSPASMHFSPKDGSKEILAKVAKKMSDAAPSYIYGFGWSFTELDRNHDFPTKEQIDAILPDVPVYIADQEGHKGLVNSYCLNHSGILDENGKVRDDFKYKDFVVVDAKGYPTGLVKEQAGTYVRSHACTPVESDEIWAKAVEDTQYLLNSKGYTAAVEGWGNQLGMSLFEAVSEMDKQGRLTYNVAMSYEIENISQAETDKGIEEAKAAAEEEEEAMNALIAEKEAQLALYETDIANKQAAIDEYDAELQAKAEVIGAIEAVIAAEREQLAEANRIRYDGGMFTWPAPQYVRISSEYGKRMHPTLGVEKFHEGLDMAAPGGSPILAAYYGKVVAAGYTNAMGNYIIIDHGDSLFTIYMHASALYVSEGEYVSAGQKIAAVGSTGRSTGNHLHFGVRLNGDYVSPWNYL